MSLLASLVRAYDRLPDAPPYGYSAEKIGFCVVLTPEGAVAEVIDLRAIDKKRSPKSLQVPAPFRRPGVTPRPMFMWDNANYALGAGKASDVNDSRFEAFCQKHLEALAVEQDPELVAFRKFLETWEPERIWELADAEALAASKVAFSHRDTYRDHYLHMNARARDIWAAKSDDWRAVEGKNATISVCLVKGQLLPVARTHAAIKGIPSKKRQRC